MHSDHELILSNSSILLAEDEENVRHSFKKVLELYVKEVHEAKDGEEAYALYQQHSPDIIFTDIKMPRLNGLELIKKIRSCDKTTPIIVTSAYADQSFLLESIKLSLVEYLIKPIQENDLLRVLETSAEAIMGDDASVLSLNNHCTYDFHNKTLKISNKDITLTSKEIEFFELLIAHRGTLVTKQSIEDALYIYEEAPPSALKNLVFKLRKKTGNDLIKTVGKLGYMVD